METPAVERGVVFREWAGQLLGVGGACPEAGCRINKVKYHICS